MTPPARTPTRRLVLLSAVMFLQYAIWGAWLPLFWGFMQKIRGFEGGQIGQLFGFGAAGALLAPFLAGQLADRAFRTERVLAVCHLLGAGLVWQLADLEGYWPLLAFCFGYSLVYAPTLALTNSLAFHHLADRDAEFGKVRLWGTLGWIAAGIGIGHWLLRMHTPAVGAALDPILVGALERAPELEAPVSGRWTEALASEPAAVDLAQKAGIGDAFRLSSILGVALGLLCLALPRTPPSSGREPFAFLAALRAIRADRALATIFLIGLPMSCLHQLYFVGTAPFLTETQGGEGFLSGLFGAQGGGLMTIGQMSEILVLAAMPILLSRLSKRTVFAIGLGAFTLRFLAFAFLPGQAFAILPALALHGVCFGCFWFVCFLLVDEGTGSDVRATAQSLFNLVLIGVGIIVGNLFTGALFDWAGEGPDKWARFFGAAALGTALCLAALLILFPRERRAA